MSNVMLDMFTSRKIKRNLTHWLSQTFSPAKGNYKGTSSSRSGGSSSRSGGKNWREEEKNLNTCCWQKGYERMWVIKSNGDRDIMSLLCAGVFSMRQARNLTSRMVQLKDASSYSFSSLYFSILTSSRILRISYTILSDCL
ncbi:hypothetical protein ERO13_A10G162401v2 [Gossypium hirsutum]|uniref:Uncharacterized protein isoform X3 n=1 Tax=Gossypium hirsutum TaxID=3635 RepID=A0A1U8INT4_GOSHI|nr:uncharacterized protein LOC107896718 isoform X3 [Gossypium hirsutum]KAG4180384.1 hypothetical protein ERO13_A10G162401v2 [Gossypium hirsutum]